MFESSPQLAELFSALAQAKKTISNPTKTKTAKIELRAGGTKQYSYADLAEVIDLVTGPLAEQGLSVIQPIISCDYGYSLKTILCHSSGQFISSLVSLPVANDAQAQALGSAITYLRRYSLLAILGLQAGEEDDDGHHASTAPKQANSAPKPQSKPRPNFGILVELSQKNGYAPSDVSQVILNKYNKKSSSELTPEEFEDLVAMLKEPKK